MHGNRHHRFHIQPMITSGGSWNSFLTAIGDGPPFFTGGGIFSYGGKIFLKICAVVFKIAEEIFLAL